LSRRCVDVCESHSDSQSKITGISLASRSCPSEIISTLVTNYRTLTLVNIIARFESSAVLLNVIECCRGIEELVVDGKLRLERSDFEAISSLRRLKFLQLRGFEITAEAVAPLAQCNELKELYLWMSFADLEAVLSVVGGKLKGLSFQRLDAIDLAGVFRYCRNVQLLYFEQLKGGRAVVKEREMEVKRELIRLRHFEVGNSRFRFGSEWFGYEE
jgi:hypothetical protein